MTETPTRGRQRLGATDMEKLEGVEWLAETLDVPVQTIYRWRKHRKGPPAYRLGKALKFKPSEVENWLDQQRDDGR